MLANMEFTLLGTAGEAPSLVDAAAANVQAPDLPVLVGRAVLLGTLAALPVAGAARQNVHRAMRRFLLALGALVAFSAGGGKVGLAIGPLLPLFDTAGFAVPILGIRFFGEVGLLLGSWMASTRMRKHSRASTPIWVRGDRSPCSSPPSPSPRPRSSTTSRCRSTSYS